jgi:signal peptidase I
MSFWQNMMKILRISGHSLEPEFQDGDFVLISKIPFFLRHARRGDVVAFNKPPYGLLIKRVEYLTPAGELFVLGSNFASIDSLQFGPVRRQDVLGKVIGHIQKPRLK